MNLKVIELQLFAKANPQDDDKATYIDDKGVERYSGTNNRVGGNVYSNDGSGLATTKSNAYNGVKTTTAETYDGDRYTFAGDNWIKYAEDNGITSGLKQALTYPSYVTADEANRFLNENIDLYSKGTIDPVDFGAGVFDRISKEDALNYRNYKYPNDQLDPADYGISQPTNTGYGTTGGYGTGGGRGAGTGGSGNYTGDEYIDAAIDDYINRQPFTYDLESDPLYQQIRSAYTRDANRAIDDTLAAVASGAGGMNSYAVSAAMQAGNEQMSRLNDIAPELQQIAYDMWRDGIELDESAIRLLLDIDNAYYNRDMAEREYADDSRATAFNQAMALLESGIMPSDTLLAQAGISLAQAQAYIDGSVNGSGATGTGTGGGTPPKPAPIKYDDEYWGNPINTSDGYNLVADTVDRMYLNGKSEDVIGDYVADRINDKTITVDEAEKILMGYGIPI